MHYDTLASRRNEKGDFATSHCVKNGSFAFGNFIIIVFIQVLTLPNPISGTIIGNYTWLPVRWINDMNCFPDNAAEYTCCFSGHRGTIVSNWFMVVRVALQSGYCEHSWEKASNAHGANGSPTTLRDRGEDVRLERISLRGYFCRGNVAKELAAG